MPVSLRPYQDALFRSAMRALGRVRRVLVQCPTGGGKTVVATATAEAVGELHQRVWFICHRDELIHQTSLTFAKAGIEHSFIAARRDFNVETLVHICSIDTLKSRLASITVRPDVIIWDECHHVGAAGWSRVMEAYPEAYHIGLSATPIRLSGEGLDAQFDEMVVGPSVAWLIESGYLAPYRYFAPCSPELDEVHTRGGDYVATEAARAMTPRLTGIAVEHWKRHSPGMRTIGFAVNVEHSKAIVAEFIAAGIPAAHLDGDTPKAERAETIKRFASGELLVLMNVNLFAEGFDLSAAAGTDVTVDCVILMRPTQSLGKFLQMVGRALRWAKDKVAIIIDAAGNVERHGLPDDEREWTLAGTAKPKREGDVDGPLPPLTCGSCFNQVRRPAVVCPYCQGALTKPQALPKATKGELREIQRAEREAQKAAEKAAKELARLAKQTAKAAQEQAHRERRQQEKREERSCVTEQDFIDLGKVRGYHRGWAEARWSLRKSRQPAGFQR